MAPPTLHFSSFTNEGIRRLLFDAIKLAQWRGISVDEALLHIRHEDYMEHSTKEEEKP